jgi:hypothetical protein
VLEGEHVVGGAVFSFDTVEMGEHDEHGSQAATDLDAYDSSGLSLRRLWQGSTPVALLYRARADGVLPFENGVKRATAGTGNDLMRGSFTAFRMTTSKI